MYLVLSLPGMLKRRRGIFMVPSDLLLQLITHLQNYDSVAHGRRALLDYLRKSTGASLGLVFALHQEDHVLTLLERSGRRPRRPAPSRSDLIQFPHKEVFDPKNVPLDGVFYHALFKQGLLVLCFSSGRHAVGKERAGTQPTIDEGSLLIGISLLSVYLSNTETDTLSTLYKLHIAEQKAMIEQERSRIAHDIHDGLVQQIAYVLRKLEFVQRTLEKQPTTEAALHEIAQASSILEASLNDLRRGISSLIPRQLEELGFHATLQALLD